MIRTLILIIVTVSLSACAVPVRPELDADALMAGRRMLDAGAQAVREGFSRSGEDPAQWCYFGESVLLPEYRGQGIGHAFFDQREAQAKACGATAACFAAVIRPDDHPARPEGYAPHDAFWTKRGYAVVQGLVTELAWKEHGEEGESLKAMQYWLRRW